MGGATVFEPAFPVSACLRELFFPWAQLPVQEAVGGVSQADGRAGRRCAGAINSPPSIYGWLPV